MLKEVRIKIFVKSICKFNRRRLPVNLKQQKTISLQHIIFSQNKCMISLSVSNSMICNNIQQHKNAAKYGLKYCQFFPAYIFPMFIMDISYHHFSA